MQLRKFEQQVNFDINIDDWIFPPQFDECDILTITNNKQSQLQYNNLLLTINIKTYFLMQVTFANSNPAELYRNKFTNLTVKQIELNLENDKCMSNNCISSGSFNKPLNKMPGYQSKHPFKIYQPRRHLFPVSRKQLPALLKPINQKNSPLQDSISGMQNTGQLSQPLINIAYTEKRKENSLIQHNKKISKKNNSLSSQKYPQRLQSGKSNARNTFLLNSIIEILKTGEESVQTSANETTQDVSSSIRKSSNIRKIHLKTEPTEQHFNQFFDLGCPITTKTKRGPRILQNEMTRLGNHNIIRSRKLYSEQKSRAKNRNLLIGTETKNNSRMQKEVFGVQKQKMIEDTLHNVQILTFYNGNKKKVKTQAYQQLNSKQEDQNQFVFEF